jgi:hypothetical protein
MCTDLRALDMAKRQNAGACLDARIFEDAMGADAYA